MKHIPLLLALLLFALPLGAAEVLPTTGKAVGLIRDDTPGSWAVVSQDFNPVDVKEFDGDEAAGFLGCYFEGPAGRYLAIKSGSGKLKTFAVVLGGGSVVIPPGPPTPPDPPPKPPEPPLPPVVPGPRQVLILRESGDDNPAMSRLLVSLSSGKGRDYLKSKGHAYFSFDADGKREDGSPDPKVVAWKNALNIKMPCVAILDSTGAILHKASLPDSCTADNVLDILRAWEAK